MTLTLSRRFSHCLAFTAFFSIAFLLFSNSSHHFALIEFFCDDLPPLHGLLRIIAYSGILCIAFLSRYSRPPLGDSPLHAPQLWDFTLPAFFSLEGAMTLIGSTWITSARLRFLRNAVLVCWLCCIAGFGGQLPSVVVGLGTLLLHGVTSGLIGTSHRWYVPTYALLALMFAAGNASYSLDAFFAARFTRYPFAPLSLHEAPLLNSGFARKIILMASICTLVFGGITKMLNGGLQWLSGSSLAYYVSSDENGHSPMLKRLMHTQPVISLFLSVSSIVLECGSIAAVFLPSTRAVILLNAAAFHFGIWLTMWSVQRQKHSVSRLALLRISLLIVFVLFFIVRPSHLLPAIAFSALLPPLVVHCAFRPNYAPQTFCYGLGTAWWWEHAPSLKVSKLLASSWMEAQDTRSVLELLLTRGPSALPLHLSSTPFLASCCAFSLFLFLSFATLYRIECWPITGVPMYSFFRDNSFSYRFLRDEQQAQQVAIEHMQSGYPNALAWSNLWIILRLKNTDPAVASEIEAVRQRRRLQRARGVHEVKGDDVDELWYVNLKARATAEGVQRGVVTKQWRRTLHNIAALDMAAKPKGKIRCMRDGKRMRMQSMESGTSGDDADAEAEDEAQENAEEEDETMEEEHKLRYRRDPNLLHKKQGAPLAPIVYPAELWLLTHRAALRRYAQECNWHLPAWADKTGELQLRVKLKHGYAVLARCPWREEDKQAAR